MSRRANSLILCLGFCLLVIGGAVFELKRSYDRTYTEASQRLKNSSYLIGEWIKGAFQASDYVLRDIVSEVDPAELRYPAPDPARHAERSAWLAAKRDSVPNAFLVGLFDANCIVTHSPQPKGPLGFDASGREFCRLLKENPEASSVVTPLFLTNFGRYSITQARRVHDENGGFRGLATLGMDVELFSRLIDTIDIGPGDVVSITDRNLRLVARKPALPGDTGRKVSEASIEAFIASDDTFASFHQESPFDGKFRLVGAQKVEGLPFIVFVGEADAVWMAEWHRRIADVLGATALLIAAAGTVLYHYRKQLDAADRLLRLATTDPLTGVSNRRDFIERAANEFRRARRYGPPLAVMMFDIDQFKRINDSFGHTIGDRAIAACASACRAGLRDIDLIGRMGGDEFAILLPDVSADHLATVSERIRHAIESVELRSDEGRPVPLTVSIGAVLVEAGAGSIDDALVDADKQLYVAKNGGRNRVCVGTMDHGRVRHT